MVILYHGKMEEIIPQIAGVDHVITDPPYSDCVHAKSRRGGAGLSVDGSGHEAPCSYSRTKELGFDAITETQRGFCGLEFSRLARRWVLVFSDVESSHLWRESMPQLDYVRTGAWVKIGATPQFTGDRPATGFEAITICHPKGRKTWNGGGSHAVWSVPIVLNRGGGDPRLHTTQKPLRLMSRLIELFTDPNDTILDCFAGSGTTLRAAKDLGRKSIGVEMDEAYCETIARRMAQEVFTFT